MPGNRIITTAAAISILAGAAIQCIPLFLNQPHPIPAAPGKTPEKIRADSTPVVRPCCFDTLPRDAYLVEEHYESGRLKAKYSVVRDPNGAEVRHGPYCVWYENRALMAVGSYDHGNLDGRQMTWFSSGVRESECVYRTGVVSGRELWWNERGLLVRLNTYTNGVPDGEFVRGYDNGRIKEEGFYRNGQLDGTMVFYFSNGDKKAERRYRSGKLVGEKIFSTREEQFH